MTTLVTGGGGFLGGALVRALVARGAQVRTLQRGDYPALAALGVQSVRGDLADPAAVASAVTGCELVFHVAAKAGIAGPSAAYRRANVLGTANVLAACRRHGVGRLVYTSTPSVVHAGHDLAGVDETVPYPARYDSPYPRTKAAAERLVLAASGPDLATVALRPHLVWGPGDRQLVARIIARARRGRLRFVAGGRAVVDSTYVENAVAAHLLAAERLRPGAPCAGRAYFIAQGEPRPIRELVNGILAAAGLPPERRSVPLPVAYAAGALAEAACRLTRRHGDPPMTRFLARQLATDHWFDLGAARRDLDYVPAVSLAEGLDRLRHSLQSPDPRADHF